MIDSNQHGVFARVLDVQRFSADEGVRSFIDRPQPGDILPAGDIKIVGWAIDPSGPLQRVEIEAAGQVIARVMPAIDRPDLAQAFPGATHAGSAGFCTAVGLAGLGTFELIVCAVTSANHRVLLGTISLERLPGEQTHATGVTLVSVVVTIPSTPHGVAGTIDSIREQTYPNIEIVVVDGGVTSPIGVTTAEPDVRVVRLSAASTPAQRNAGFAEAKGTVIAFLEAGERLEPDGIESGLRELAAAPDAALAVGRCGVLRPYHDDAEFPQQPVITNDAYRTLLRLNPVVTSGAALFRRAVLEREGGFDDTLTVLSDYELLLRVARTNPVAFHRRTVISSSAPDPFAEHPELAIAELSEILCRQLVDANERPEAALGLRLAYSAWGDRLGVRLSPGGQPDDLAAADVETLPPVGQIGFGDLRRLLPITRNFGYGRGTPVDRHYIEAFLDEHRSDVRGRVLEVQEDDYTRRFGADQVTVREVLSLLPGNPRATIVADLARPQQFTPASFDCAIVTQVLHLLPDPRPAIRTLHRILRPGGVALVTVPGISQVEWAESWHWSFTVLSAQDVFHHAFGRANVSVKAYGNVLAATSFLWGLAVEDLEPSELDVHDPNYQVTIAVRAVKR